ncbi:NhaC family Na+:H+ antiporter [Desulfitispora alkaliphila]|uniref:Na+/H+ antiporter NhaC n=1 Tax=Desulfitispora alkaliphila TaxID=622674 RepID=UPI003D1F61E7
MKRNFTVGSATLLFVLMLATMIYSILYLGVHPHIPLLLCLVVLAIISRGRGYKWDEIETSLIDGIKVGLKPIMILGLIGITIAVWMMSGTVPYLLDLGFSFISPQWFAISALFICIIVSSFTGSSFTTIGTVGVALMGIGIGLGINPAIAAGAIVSGACFGDKMSPLSDTTNFASGIVKVDLFTHIRHLLWTTVPSLCVTIIIFYFIGKTQSSLTSFADIELAKNALATNFNLSVLSLISPLLVIILAVKRWPTIPVIMVGIVSGIITAVFLQNNVAPAELFNVLQGGFSIETESALVNGVVNRGGLQSKMWSISLIIIALALGGLIQGVGLIQTLLDGFKKWLTNRGHLITSTALSAIAVNLTTGEQYLSILLPGQTYQHFYEKANLHPKNLSRTVEDAGTLINPLIPWGVSGAFFYSTLGVSVVEYAPYAFFLFLSPIFAIIFGYLNIGIAPLNTKE